MQIGLSFIRPISCCSVIYKHISKVIAGRLKRVAGSVVSLSQAGFISGRQLGDNVLLATKIIRGYVRKNLSPKCMIKIDMRKAYDSIAWPFLKSILQEFGFPHKFSSWVMACVGTVSYLVLINGKPSR